jgi:single-strand DNA-binding protein
MPEGKHTSKVGNLTRDPELKYSDKGTAWAKFSIAVNEPKTPGDWKGEKITVYFDCVAFGSLAENVTACLVKGDRVLVEGTGSIEKFKRQDGSDGKSNKIACNAVGAELRFTEVEISKVTRTQPDNEGADENSPF